LAQVFYSPLISRGAFVFVFCSGTIAQWYFSPNSYESGTSRAYTSFRHAIGPQFGSLSEASLILTVVQVWLGSSTAWPAGICYMSIDMLHHCPVWGCDLSKLYGLAVVGWCCVPHPTVLTFLGVLLWAPNEEGAVDINIETAVRATDL
jgi:hypothetical protein